MKTNNLLAIDLQLFADGGAEGASGAAAQGGSEAGGNQVATGDNQSAAGNVAEEGSASQDRATLFAQVKNDFKSEIDAEIQKAIRGRLKNSTEFKNKVNPIVSMLARKYDCEATDIDSIMKAMEDDDSYYSKAALERGMTVDQFRQFDKIERENAQFRLADQQRQEAADRLKARDNFTRQCDACRKTYPDFNIETESANPNFTKLIKAGFDVQEAYEFAHRHEIMKSGMQDAANKAAEQVSAAVAANNARPSENGIGSNTPVVTTIDISKLSREQLADIKKRARAGEKITFRN